LGVSKPRRSFDLSTTAAESWRGLPSIGVAGLERSRAVDWRVSTCAAAFGFGSIWIDKTGTLKRHSTHFIRRR
jgi:hypothetical protein